MLDHPKIQTETVLKAAGLMFYSPSHHLMLHLSHSVISVSRARYCSHSAVLISAGQVSVWGGISANSCKAEITNHVHTQQS